MKDILINLQKSDTCKIQLIITTNFISSKDVDEERVMHSKSIDIEFMSYDIASEVVNESLLSIYQIDLETSMRRSDFIFELVHPLHYKCHKINLKQGSSYTDFPDWIKKKKQQ